VSGSFPERARAAERTAFDGTVTITNDTDRRIEGLAASQPDVYLTRDARIVATPVPRDDVGLLLDLAPRAGRSFDTMGSLRRCADDQPLPPGLYEIHAVLRFDGKEAVGGPWQLEVA